MSVRRVCSVLCVAACWSGLFSAAHGGEIRVVNHEAGSTIRYPVALLRGELTDRSATEIVVENESSQRASRKIVGVARDGRFKALAELVPGENRLRLTSGQDVGTLVMTYNPQTNPYFVRVIYMTDSTGETAYQSQFDKDPQDYADKLDPSIKLLQTFTAERLHDIGLGRHTFHLEFDDNGRVSIHTLKGDQPAAFYYGLKDGDWYGHVYGWVKGQFADRHSKNIVIAAYTRFDPVQKKVFAHTALGGGDLGLFGGGSLFTWPSSLQDTFRVFGDETEIDATKVHEDSAGRKTVWATASTTIGATLHEMGHAFGLPHCSDGLCIMTRGFDRLNRVFTLVEPRSKHNRDPLVFAEKDAAYFAPVSATSLRASRWFQLDERPYEAEPKPPSLRLDSASGDLHISAPHGLRYVVFSVKGDARGHRAFWEKEAAPPQEVVLKADEIKQLASDESGRSRQSWSLHPSLAVREEVATVARSPEVSTRIGQGLDRDSGSGTEGSGRGERRRFDRLPAAVSEGASGQHRRIRRLEGRSHRTPVREALHRQRRRLTSLAQRQARPTEAGPPFRETGR